MRHQTLTTEKVKSLESGTWVSVAWKRDFTARPQLVRRVAGLELKVFKYGKGSVSWELRYVAMSFVKDSGSAETWAEAIEAVERAAVELLEFGLSELDTSHPGHR